MGTRTLDELLENKQIIDNVVNQHAREIARLWCTRLEWGVKDIIAGRYESLVGASRRS